jgi:AraC-like DNA-binding protein
MLSQVVSAAPGGGSSVLADVTVLAPVLIKLLDDAATAMGSDPVMARSCLAQALAELKTVALSADAGPSSPPRRGGLAPWHEHRTTALMERNLDGPILRGTFDALHPHVPNTIIAEYGDPERGQIQTTTPTQRHRVPGLPKWRLKRAIEYVTANLAEPIGLADIATATGLSRMHFAAQFRATTGLRPHDYLLRRRVERAQELLLSSGLPLVDVAFDVGFKTQAHFTTVFGRLVGETPKVWRQRNRLASDIPVLEAA